MSYETIYKKRISHTGRKKLIVKVKLPIARLDRVRDIFLFSCFTGLTFDDVDKLQEYNIEILENGKRQMKIYIPLSNKIREIPLLAIPCLILDKYKGNNLMENYYPYHVRQLLTII